MPKKIKALAFDLDGLMVNTEDLYDEVCHALLARRGFQFSLDLKLRMMGRPGPVALRILQEEFDLDDPIETLQKEVQSLFHDILPGNVQCFPGLLPLLNLAEELGLPKCVATSSFRNHAENVLGECGLENRFDFVLTSEDVTNGKPHPEVYLLAASRHSVEPAEMLVLEDSVQGTRSAVAAGSVTVAVPGRHSIGLDYSHVDHVAESLADQQIVKLLMGSRE